MREDEGLSWAFSSLATALKPSSVSEMESSARGTKLAFWCYSDLSAHAGAALRAPGPRGEHPWL